MECSKKRKNLLGKSNDLPYDSTANEGDNLEREKEKKKGKKDLNYDLNYTKNTKNYRISKVPERANYHEQIKTSTENRRHIYVLVELPHRKDERPELFRFNEYGDLVIVVNDRNMEYIFGPAIKKLVRQETKIPFLSCSIGSTALPSSQKTESSYVTNMKAEISNAIQFVEESDLADSRSCVCCGSRTFGNSCKVISLKKNKQSFLLEYALYQITKQSFLLEYALYQKTKIRYR
ncbi:hypothetical protein RhiirA5_378083 [Rhizophagus irregularis]|uniref:Uncharacterized protein n=1 Tax=Rhizophagus irregularis TaxID=588596 RepID=A0A2N0PH16_9GLOM|nr:hypothetical protein RhiirA5_378083 [Rhizophagus irregularis]